MKNWLWSKRQVTAQLWGRVARERLNSDEWKLLSWDAHPVTQEYINRRVTGNPNEGWLEFVKRRFVPAGATRGLSLGCGSGILERHALSIHLCRAIDACDLSREALDVAERVASDGGLSDRLVYFECDLNTAILEPNKYGICFSSAAMHHVENLEHALFQVKKALRPDGLFVLMEYVGPSRFQWSEKVQLLMERLMTILPEPYRRSLKAPGFVRWNLTRPSVDAVVSADPSEAVRSGEILDQLGRFFKVVYSAPIGGTLLQFLLADIVGNFRPEDPIDRALLQLLILLEETLVDEGVIPADFAMIVAKPFKEA